MPTSDSDHTLASRRPVAEAAPELPQGSKIDRYVVLELLGKGGMGVVYKAYDPQLNRGVALKLIRAQQQDNRGEASDGSARLLREAQALAQLTHPNVVAVHDVGTVEDNVFVAMELVEGKTLRAWHKATKPSTREVVEVMRAAGRGLAAAHQAALIHRDFKPDNVIVGEDGRVRVIDFGLACAETAKPSTAIASPRDRDMEEIQAVETRVHDQEERLVEDSRETPLSSSSTDLLSSPLTRAGAIVGTPMYMAPEQHLGARVDARADQFSFCAVLYEVLYGRRPFSGKSHKGLVKEILDGRVQPRPTHTDVPKWLDGIAMRGLSTTPDERYPSMEELLEALGNDPDARQRAQRTVRRRILFVAGLVVLAAVLPFGGWYLVTEGRRLCQGARENLHGVWDEAIRGAVRDAFAATQKPYAAPTFKAVANVLDAYALHWVQMHTDACEATRLRGDQSEELLDLRMACLSRRRSEMAALTAILAEADAAVLGEAVQAAHGLLPIARCADTETLVSFSVRVKPPATEGLRGTVNSIREQLAIVKALFDTGQYAEGLVAAQAAATAADDAGYRPVQAEALEWVGVLQEHAGTYEESRRSLYKAVWTALASGDDETETRSLARLMNVVGRRLARHDEAQILQDYAAAAVRRLNKEGPIKAVWHNSLATVLLAKGEYDKVLEHYGHALAIKQRLSGPEHPDIARGLNNLGIAHYMKGDVDRALEYYRRGLEILAKSLGPQHPGLGRNLNNIGVALDARGDYDEAIAHYKRALEVWSTALGREHPDIAMTLNNMGEVYKAKGEFVQAFDYCSQALGIWEKSLGPDHPDVAMSVYNLGDLHLSMGKYDTAIPFFKRGLTILEKAVGSTHPRVAHPLTLLGKAYLLKRDYPTARMYFTRALSLRERALGVDHPLLAPVLAQMAIVALQARQIPVASQHVTRALEICSRKACDPELMADDYWTLAQAFARLDDSNPHAQSLALQARGDFSRLHHKEAELGEIDRFLQKKQ